MQIFPNGKHGKWRFHSFIEFFVMHLKHQEVKIDHSGTLTMFTPYGYPMVGSAPRARAYGNTPGVPGSEPIRPIINVSDAHEWADRSTEYESGLA